MSINSLAFLHQAAGEYAKAEPLYREALAMRRALHSKDNTPTAIILRALFPPRRVYWR